MRTPLRLVVSGGVAERLRVLLIEDDPGDALLVARLLERSDFALIHVSTMASALHSIGSQPPDIVLLDLLLPDAHGAGALTRLRAALPAAPILALTGAYEPGSALSLVRAGADDYLDKDGLTRESLQHRLACSFERERRSRQRAKASEAVAPPESLATLVHEVANPASVVVANLDVLRIALAQVSKALRKGVSLQMIEQIEECREMTAEATVAVDRIRVAVNRRIRGALATVPKADRPKKESATQPPRRDSRRLPVPITLEDRPENAGLVSDRGDRDDEI